jgi:hypothetical protein
MNNEHTVFFTSFVSDYLYVSSPLQFANSTSILVGETSRLTVLLYNTHKPKLKLDMTYMFDFDTF